MEYAVKTGAPEKQKTDCLIVPVFQGGKLGAAGKAVDAASDGYIADAVKASGDAGRVGRTVLLFRVPGVAARKVLLLGLGKAGELGPRELRKAAGAAGACALDNGVTDAIAAVLSDELNDLDEYRIARHVIEAIDYAVYRYDETKSKKDPAPRFKKLALLADDQAAAKKAREGAKHAQGIGRGVALARELGNLPGNVCTPNYLAKQARKLGRDNPKLKVSVLDEAEMKKLGMGSLLSVSRGSREPAKLIVMEYRNGPKSQKPVALVGKGLTFDAGGISLKPAPAMDEMKFDMCGGAGVFGAVAAVTEMELPVNLVALVPASENLPDGAANKPGDIVTSMSGQTIEILNTDAEGRLILCDALTYARRYKPDTVIDLATLTGACVVALGSHATGLLTKDDELANEITEAGERAWDRTWRLPLWDDYQQQLDSNFADMANVGGKEAGTVTAGCFLSRFTEGLRWAHLDIAGTAWNGGGDKGATGRPVSLLVEYLISRA